MGLAFVGETANPPTTLSGTSATTQTCTRTFTGGNAVIAFCMGIGSATTVTFSDGTNTWTTDTTLTPLGGGFQCIATGHALNVAGGSTTVTATWNASVHHSFVILVEVSGAKTASALEGIGGQFQNPGGTGTDGLTSGNPSPAPTTTANTFVCGFTCNFNNNVAPTAVGTGFTQTGAVKYTASMGGVQGEYKIVSATGTYPATFTCTTSDNWTTCVVILAEAAAAGLTAPPDYQDTPRRIQARRPPDQAHALPPVPANSWVFVEPPRVVRPRRQEPQQANPLPALPAVQASSFAPQFDAPAIARPRHQVEASIPIPTLIVPAPLTPWVYVDQPIAPRPRRQPVQNADPLPTATRLGQIVENQPARRFVRAIVNVFREAVGLPALLPPPPAELKLKPPLWAVFDEVSLTVEVDAVSLSATVDEVLLSVEDDT